MPAPCRGLVKHACFGTVQVPPPEVCAAATRLRAAVLRIGWNERVSSGVAARALRNLASLPALEVLAFASSSVDWDDNEMAVLLELSRAKPELALFTPRVWRLPFPDVRGVFEF